MQDRQRTLSERLLSLFAEVRAGEARPTILLTLSIFLLMTAYYIIKPVREGLILADNGAEVKSYAAAGQAALLLLAVPLYARLADRMPRLRLISVVTFFFVGCLGVFFVLGQAGVPLGIPFYLWVGIFNMMIIAQLWSFANDIFSPAQGQRVFAIIGFGASAGAVAGNVVVEGMIEPLGVFVPMLLAAGLLVVSLLLTRAAGSYHSPDLATGADTEAADQQAPGSGDNVFALLARNRYLMLLALLMLLSNWVNTTGEYMLSRLVGQTAEQAVATGAAGDLTEGEWISRFYAGFYLVVNVVGLLTQLFLVSRLVKYLGVRVCLMILPFIALGGYALLLVFPVLGVVRWAKTAENATDYSLQNTVRNMLWLPTSREEKYKAKQFVDTFCVRVGDMLSAAVVFVGTNLVTAGLAHFAAFNLVLAVVWLVVALVIGREFRRLSLDHPR